MARPYTSQLKLMHDRALSQSIDEGVFNAKYMSEFDLVWRYRCTDNGSQETFAILQYLAEKNTWEKFWPEEPFPGVDPAILYDGRMWEIIRHSGEKLNAKTFNKVWIECLLLAQEKFPGLRTEIQQFEAEKIFWGKRSLIGPKEKFPGIDPRPFLDPTNKEQAIWREMLMSNKGVGKRNSAETTPDRGTTARAVDKYELSESEMGPSKEEFDTARASKYMNEMFEKLGLD